MIRKCSFFVLVLMALSLMGCNYQATIEELQKQIDALKSGEIATVKTQMTNIQASLSDLQKVDAELKAYIKTLQDNLAALDGENDERYEKINKALGALESQDNALDQRITELKTYCQQQDNAVKDWATATFATLEQHNAVLSEIAAIKVRLGELGTAITNLDTTLSQKIADAEGRVMAAIGSSESQIKTWVNEQLAGYYTIAQVDAKLKVLEDALADADDALDEDIAQLRADLEKARTELTAAYQAAIAEAINKNNGIINAKIASEIQSATEKLQGQIDAITDRLDKLEARIEALEGSIASIGEQMLAIQESLSGLQEMEEELQDYLELLEAELAKLAEMDDFEKIENLLDALAAADEALGQRITNLEAYCKQQDSDTRDWVTTTFATLEQHSAVLTEIETIKAGIEALEDALSALDTSLSQKISDAEDRVMGAIETSEASMKGWVNEQLAGYYTIAQADAKLALLEAAITEGDEALAADIARLREELEKAKADLTAAYQTAIAEAIEKNNGVIDGKIATAIQTATESLQSQIDALSQRLDTLEARIDAIGTSITTIQEQISAIQESLGGLQEMEEELQDYLELLEEELKKLGEMDDIEELRALLDALAEADEALEQRIASLETYCSGLESGVHDWAEATFATLDQHSAVLTEIETIKAGMESLEDAVSALDTSLSQKISDAEDRVMDAIEDSEESLKGWVNEQLAGYYTIAQADAKLALLETAITEGDEALAADIARLREELEKAKTDLTTAYQTAIAEAISKNNGVIDGKIATAIQTATESLQSQIDALSGRLDTLEARIDAIGTSITTIQEQISAIQESLGGLQEMEEELQDYLELLEEELDKLSQMDEYEKLKGLLDALAEADEALEQRIADLEDYCQQQDADTRDWVETTFATLEQHSAVLTEIETIKAGMESLEDAVSALDTSLSQKISDAEDRVMAAIEDSEESLKGWVNEQLAGYYTIAQTDAKLALLEAAMAEGDEALAADIAKLREDLEKAKADLTSAYQAAIAEAIETNNGVIDGKIATAIQTATDNLQNQIDAITLRLDSLEARIAALETAVSELIGMVQSVVVVPDYSDGSVKISGKNTNVIYFEVYPLEAARKLAGKGPSVFSLDYVDTETKAPVSHNIPISAVAFDGEYLSITADGSGLPESIRQGDQTASARLRISDGHVTRSSEYFPLYYLRDTVPEPEMVDLGLSVKWASFNLGASAPEEYGDYYAWGEVEPYYESQNPLTWKEGKSAGYNWASYKWCHGSSTTLTRYCPANKSSYWGGTGNPDGKTEFSDYDYADDAARANLGGTWRMPTDAEWTELRDNCTWTWTTLNGIYGYMVTSKKAGYTDKRIFLPAAGNRYKASLYDVGSGGYYWSSSLVTYLPLDACGVYFGSGNVDEYSPSRRFYGHSVRPVYDDAIHVTSVSLNKTSLSLYVGRTETLTATITPSNATNQNVTWTSSDTNVATVDATGKVTGVAAGIVTITVTTVDGNITATCSVEVRNQGSATLPVPDVVDLGLSVKWASFNLGASAPEEYGDYYAWGEVEPYYESQNPLTWKEGKSAGYNWASYKWCHGSSTTLTRYCPANKSSYWGGTGNPDGKTEFSDYDYADDAARANLGGTWRMPTNAEWAELRDNCTWEWTTLNGVNGRKVTSKKAGYKDKWIFLPAAGSRYGTFLRNVGSYGSYWSSSLSTDDPYDAWGVGFYSGGVDKGSSGRYIGLSVRPVTE